LTKNGSVRRVEHRSEIILLGVVL